jgi:hypothetical protein
MPLGVFSRAGWNRKGHTEFHHTLFLGEKLLGKEPIEGLPEHEERPE